MCYQDCKASETTGGEVVEQVDCPLFHELELRSSPPHSLAKNATEFSEHVHRPIVSMFLGCY